MLLESQALDLGPGGADSSFGVGKLQMATITVNSTADAVDATPDGVCAAAAGTCTLRAAIQEANSQAGPQVISVPSGTYALTLTGSGEDQAATGDLDVTDDLLIGGAGATTIVDGNGTDRIFHVIGDAVELSVGQT